MTCGVAPILSIPVSPDLSDGRARRATSFRQQSATAPQQIFAFGGEPNAAARAVE